MVAQSSMASMVEGSQVAVAHANSSDAGAESIWGPGTPTCSSKGSLNACIKPAAVVTAYAGIAKDLLGNLGHSDCTADTTGPDTKAPDSPTPSLRRQLQSHVGVQAGQVLRSTSCPSAHTCAHEHNKAGHCVQQAAPDLRAASAGQPMSQSPCAACNSHAGHGPSTHALWHSRNSSPGAGQDCSITTSSSGSNKRLTEHLGFLQLATHKLPYTASNASTCSSTSCCCSGCDGSHGRLPHSSLRATAQHSMACAAGGRACIACCSGSACRAPAQHSMAGARACSASCSGRACAPVCPSGSSPSAGLPSRSSGAADPVLAPAPQHLTLLDQQEAFQEQQQGQGQEHEQSQEQGQVREQGSQQQHSTGCWQQPEIVPLEEPPSNSSRQHSHTAAAAATAAGEEPVSTGPGSSSSIPANLKHHADDAASMFNMFSTCHSNSFTTSCHTTQAGQKVLIVRAGASWQHSPVTAVFVKEPTGEVWEAPVEQVTITITNTPAAGAAAAGAGAGTNTSPAQPHTPVTPAHGCAAGLSADAAAKLIDAMNHSTAGSSYGDVVGGSRHAGSRACSSQCGSDRRASSRGCSCEMDRRASSRGCSCFSSRIGSMCAATHSQDSSSSSSTNTSKHGHCSSCSGPHSSTAAEGASCRCSCSSGSCHSRPAQQGQHSSSHGPTGTSPHAQPGFWRRLGCVLSEQRFSPRGRKQQVAEYLEGLDEAAHRAMRVAGCQSFLLPRQWPERARKEAAQQRRLRVLLAAYKA